jgi:hypothetical protein
LLIVQASADKMVTLLDGWSQTLRSWPRWLIAVVFAGMRLEQLTLAFGIGLALQWVVTESVSIAESWHSESTGPGSTQQPLSERLTLHSVFGSFLLFIYAIVGDPDQLGVTIE